MEKLNDRQRRFVDEYIIDLNATQAAIRAGYSERSARNTASRMMANDNISEAISKRMKEKEKSLIATQDEILQTLTRQSRREEIDYNVVVLKEKVIEDGVITETERVEVVQVPTRNTDSIRASELLGKRYGMWTDKVEQTNTNLNINVGEWDDD